MEMKAYKGNGKEWGGGAEAMKNTCSRKGNEQGKEQSKGKWNGMEGS